MNALRIIAAVRIETHGATCLCLTPQYYCSEDGKKVTIKEYSAAECKGTMTESIHDDGVCETHTDDFVSTKVTITDCAGDEAGAIGGFFLAVILAIVLGICL
eukprot:SAG31_NODE_17829_length_656_cov_1.244165_1_plen_102_part_00